MDDFERITPYEMAVVVFNRWSTEVELLDELKDRTESNLSEPMQEFIRFCVKAMLYRFNILINPKYTGLFVSDGSTSVER